MTWTLIQNDSEWLAFHPDDLLREPPTPYPFLALKNQVSPDVQVITFVPYQDAARLVMTKPPIPELFATLSGDELRQRIGQLLVLLAAMRQVDAASPEDASQALDDDWRWLGEVARKL